MFRVVIWASLLLVSGCWGRGDTGQREKDSETDPIDTGDGCTSGYGVRGVAWDIAADAPAAEGLCIHVADPTNALIGQDIELLVSSTVGTDGDYQLCGIRDRPQPGLLLVVNDCDEAAPTVAQTSTGIAKADYIDLRAGDMLEDRVAYVVTLAYRDAIAASFETAGYDDDGNASTPVTLTAGFTLGRVVDANLDPLAGATVIPGCTQCIPSFYFDDDDTDGFFTTGTTVNASTSLAANAMWANPKPFIADYDAFHPTETFETTLFGSVAGNAGYLRMIATGAR